MRKVSQFILRSDQYTDLITSEISAKIKSITGLSLFVLIAEVNRTQIDFNRAANQAYEHPSLKKCYKDFHAEVCRLIMKIKQKWQAGLMLDIYGQSTFPDYIFRGVRNGVSVKQMKKRLGTDAFSGTENLFSYLSNKGYRVLPEQYQRETIYQGGFMLKTYGSQHLQGIDAIQIEISRHYRKSEDQRKRLSIGIAKGLMKQLSVIKIID